MRGRRAGTVTKLRALGGACVAKERKKGRKKGMKKNGRKTERDKRRTKEADLRGRPGCM